MNGFLRALLLVIAVFSLIFAVGFFLQAPWATAVWPLPASRLSNIFLSSILAAIGAPILWIGLSGETRALSGGGLNLAVANLGAAIFAAQLYLRGHALALWIFAIATLLMAAFSAVVLVYSLRFDFHDPRPTPGLVRAAFGVFALILALAGGALVLRRPNIFPWPISPETGVFYGWIFLGAMCYFLYGVLAPRWANARGQLLGFLAYDLVLIVPFLLHFQSVRPDLRVSLMLYTAVLVASGALAVYALFIDRRTRFTGQGPAKADAGAPILRQGG